MFGVEARKQHRPMDAGAGGAGALIGPVPSGQLRAGRGRGDASTVPGSKEP